MSLRYYMHLLRTYATTTVAAQAGFRANFVISTVISVFWPLLFLQMISIVFHNTQSVAGWSSAEVLTIFGMYQILDSTMSMFIWDGLSSVPTLIRNGTIDYMVTKPANSQFQASFYRFSLQPVANVVVGVAIASFGITQSGHAFLLSSVLYALALLVCSMLLYYSIFAIAVTCSFWFIRLENITMLVTVSYIMSRYPLNVFEGFVRKFVFFIIPLAFFVTVPAMVLFDKVDPLPWVVGGLSLAIVFTLFSYAFWQYALRSYSSASS